MLNAGVLRSVCKARVGAGRLDTLAIFLPRCLADYVKVTPVKRLKLEENEAPLSPPLSPEQLDRIERNKRAALERLAARNVPEGFGVSWRKALSAEFGKPYFIRLMAFVAAEQRRHTIYPPQKQIFSWTQVCDIQDVKVVILGQDPYHGPEQRHHTIYPPQKQIFSWTQVCDIQDVKVVILGQDPYHGPNQAHGLCFSVQKPVPPPPSLENMYTELAADIEGFEHPGHGDLTGWAKQVIITICHSEVSTRMSDPIVFATANSTAVTCLENMYTELAADIEGFEHPGHGDLTGWAKQGVLLLNAVLTVRAHQANSHKDRGWEQFTDSVVQWLNNNQEGLVFMLWGAYAQKKGFSIDRKRHHVLQAVHPSPLSAHRGFFGCKHFSKTNEWLKKSGKKPIDWTAL
ncbi:UNVERIFIED_CONTAM: hypothetical protein FKN15_008279 [Acipenser sinensis]